MKIASNRISDIIRFFHTELAGIYPPEELAVIIRYCFEEFTGITSRNLSAAGEQTVSESVLLKFSFAVKDLKKEKPLQYILGKADFYGLVFSVNEDVLIPRPETEELVHLIIRDVIDSGLPETSILDIGTGSGCIAVSIKKALKHAKVSACDISEKALLLAKKNADANNAEINFFPQNILSPSEASLSERYHIIVSNPPYIRFSEKEAMNKNVLEYEPHLALFVENDDALIFYDKIADFALKTLLPGGRIYFEINSSLGSETKKIIESKGFKNVEIIKDMSDKNRILRGTL